MHKKLTLSFIFILAFILLIIVCRFLFIAEKPLLNQVGFYEDVYGMELDPYYDEEKDTYYIFVPAYVTMEDMEIECTEFVKGDFSNDSEDFGSDMAELPLSEDITLTLKNFYQQETYNFQIWKYDNLPTVYIDTETEAMESVNADKNYEEDASVVVIDSDGTIEISEMSTISGRGNGTWGKEKNPYTLKFGKEINLGPFESTKTLCLLANYSDETRIRNAIAYYAGEKIGIPYSSPYMNVNVYANGEYLGLYGIVTKYEYKKYIEEDRIKGVFEMQVIRTSADAESLETQFNDALNVMYGNTEEIQYAVGQLETAIATQDWKLCDSLIDVKSFAEKYAFDEFMANHDLATGGGYGSHYFFLDDAGIIHCMLPWDYDWSLASSRTFFNELQATELKVYRTEKNWFALLLESDYFVEEVHDILITEFTDEYIEDLMRYIIFLIDDVETSWQCDMVRWQDETPYNIWDNSSGIEDLYGYIDYFSTYFPERRAFLISYFSNPDDYCRVQLRAKDSLDDCFNILIPVGENLWDYIDGANILDENRKNGYTFSGWYTEDGISLYDIGIVTEDLFFTGDYEKIVVEEISAESTEMIISETEVSEQNDSNRAVELLKRFYHASGLDSFGKGRLILCGVFVLVLLGFIIGEIVNYSRWRRAGK